MPAVGFEPTISAGERPQTYALERATTGTDGIHQLLATNKGRLTFPGAKDCQGQLQTLQSVSVVVTFQSFVTDIATRLEGGTSPTPDLRIQLTYLF
jgi:hypothetical protein